LIAVSRRSWLLGVLSAVGLAATCGLGYEDSCEALALVRGAGKQGPRYTTERAAGGHVELGRCQITIPSKNHHVGEIESPSVLRLEICEDELDHVVLQKTERLADAQFYDVLRERVSQSARRELFVFIHGFNVSFEDAARRTAQIHYDLKFDGAPIFFSWPAHDRFILTYPADETNVSWSTPHLKQFLLEIAKESGAKSINLIAHSMGNRALAAALREIDLQMHDSARLFNQVILAAPDIDADEFKNNIAPAMQRTAQRLTLYASAHDEALLASRFIHRSPRAGDAGAGLIVVPGIDTIDVTAIDYSLWGHSYYGSSNPVLHDLQLLLSRAVPPRDRTWLSPADHDGLVYWIFRPARTASAEEATLK
jgi:esterase/lipase superfamily enzyme